MDYSRKKASETTKTRPALFFVFNLSSWRLIEPGAVRLPSSYRNREEQGYQVLIVTGKSKATELLRWPGASTIDILYFCGKHSMQAKKKQKIKTVFAPSKNYLLCTFEQGYPALIKFGGARLPSSYSDRGKQSYRVLTLTGGARPPSFYGDRGY